MSQQHQLEPRADGETGVACTACKRTWKHTPRTTCPGVQVYGWGTAPEHLKTVTQLKKARLKLAQDQPAQGCIIGQRTYYLYDKRQAVTRPPATLAQLAALEKARTALTCVECGERVRRKSLLRGELCTNCRRERQIQNMIEKAKDEAIAWAREVLGDPGVIVLDTETTGLDRNAEIVEIAVMDVHGQTLLDTLIRPHGTIPVEASAIHGIEAADVADAPAWPEIHDQLAHLLYNASKIVIYNASYDKCLLDQTRALYDLPPFEIEPDRLECAMEAYAKYIGDWSRSRGSFRWWPLNGGHRALGDCQATLDVIREMAAGVVTETLALGNRMGTTGDR